MIAKIFLIIGVSVLITGCKKTYRDKFDYVIQGNNLCAIKNEQIVKAKSMNWIYPEIKNLADTVISSDLNFAKDRDGFLICTDINKLREKIKNGAIRTSIGVEVEYGSYTKEYKLVNYSCISKDSFIFNISKEEAFEKCK